MISSIFSIVGRGLLFVCVALQPSSARGQVTASPAAVSSLRSAERSQPPAQVAQASSGSRTSSAQAADPRELLKQLDSVSIDPSQIYALRHAEITRDRLKIYFNRGFVGFLTSVGGEITGAAFSGDGEVLLIPPSAPEKRNLAQFTQSPILEEQFTSAYMRFTDQTARDLLAAARRPDLEDVEQPAGFAERWNALAPQLHNADDSMRILEDLLGERDRPLFQARIEGVNLGAFDVRDDERAPEAVTVGTARRIQGKLLADIWCAFPTRASEARGASLLLGSAGVRSYKIDTRINPDNSLDGRAELELESRSGADRVLVFALSHHLKVAAVSEIREAHEQSLAFFQNPSLEESEAAERGDDWVVAALPAPHPAGERFRLTFAYQGNVIADVGNGVLYVGAHGSWFPNHDLIAPASYDLTFHYPDWLTLVATGHRVGEDSSAGLKHSHWVSDGAFRVAGFNLGAYDTRVRRVGKTTIEVYATPEAEAALEKRHLSAQGSGPASVLVGRSPIADGVLPRQAAPLVPAALLDDVSDSAARALRYFETLFGPYPYSRLAISQIPGNFGQGWPELVYLPTLSFLPASTRSEFFAKKGEAIEDQLFVAHEIAHQWWGNEVGWKTYHDQWLSEGFASYAAALELLVEKDGESKFRELMRTYKRDLMRENKDGSTVESDGPIWLGQRLSNSLDPDGYDAIVYKKACWVLHMLRALMSGPESETGASSSSGPVARAKLGVRAARPDEKFFKMLRDFVLAYRGGNPSTEDFIRHAEKYMTRASDLERNRKLDWFFADWVFGAGIPTYKLHVTTRRLASGKFVLEGTIDQSDVPPDFEMLVPVVAMYGKERKATLGRVAVSESGGHFRFTTSAKPTRVAIDEDEILASVR